MSLTAIVLLAAAASAPVSALPTGSYSNEEEVYFDQEDHRPPAPWTAINVGDDGRPAFVDAFGAPASKPAYKSLTAATPNSLTLEFADGRSTILRRGRPVTCWASIKKDQPKPDGSEDWFFVKDVHLHDQGGRVLVGGGVAGVKPVVLRMRNVTWSGSGRSSNRPSLVLYIHTPDQPDHAVSYVWADPGAARLGVNLRWMQTSCTVDGLDRGATGSETKTK